MTRTLASIALFGLALSAAPVATGLTLAPAVAHAKKKNDDGGIPLAIQVLGPDGMPLSTAKVRNPQEKEPHSVRTNDGTWEGDVLYLPDGTEVFFDKGMELTFEVSAPGYKNRKITYVMRKRKNKVVVQLEKLKLGIDDFEDEDPVIQFGRDKPIGGRPID
jgi:hypothetical protein